MTHFADISLTELSPILAIFTGMLIGFYGIFKFALKQASDERKADRDERKQLVKAIQDMANSNRAIAQETNSMKMVHEKGYLEAEQRNGHLAEMTMQSRDKVLAAISEVKNQHVGTQIVDKQEVKK